MEQVEGLIAYHISLDKEFAIGSIIECGKKRNGVYKKYLRSKLSLFKSDIDKRRIAVQSELEKVRKKDFPNAPSRFYALFVSLDRTLCEKIIQDWKCKKKNPKQLLILKLDGVIQKCAHQNPNENSNLSLSEIRQRLYNYWNGQGQEIEYLFCGKATVIDVEKLY